MIDALGVALTGGCLAGLVHVLSGPDHLAAIAPLAIEGRDRTWLAGFLWGLGHTAGVVLVGGLFLLLRHVLPSIESVSGWGDRAVGAALIGIGTWGFFRASRIVVEGHQHAGGKAHAHVHVHHHADNDHRHVPPGHLGAAMAMGVLHGLAGTSHILGVLPALALPTRNAGFVYLAGFGGATIAGMAAFSSLVGLAAAGATRTSNLRLYRGLLIGSGTAACVVGLIWLLG